MDEWELLVTTEDIEPGDFIRVERPAGLVEDMVLVKEEGRYGIVLKDGQGKTHQFTRLSLEQVGGNGWITGKSKS